LHRKTVSYIQLHIHGDGQYTIMFMLHYVGMNNAVMRQSTRMALSRAHTSAKAEHSPLIQSTPIQNQ